MSWISLAAVLAAALLHSARAQGPAIELSVSTTSAVLGLPVKVTARAVLPQGSELALDLQASATDSFSIRGSAPGPSVPAQGGVLKSETVDVLPLALGRVEIPLYFKPAGSEKVPVLAAPLVLNVSPPRSLKAGADIDDVKTPLSARLPFWPWLALLAAAAAAYLYWRGRRASGAGPAGVVIDARTPEEASIQALKDLLSSGIWEKGLFGEFYFALTEILRRYLEKRAGVPATRQTTAELLRHLRRAAMDKGLLSTLQELFGRADLVKFAKLPPDPSWGRRDVEAAGGVVAALAPRPAPAPEGAAAGGAKG